MHRLSIGNDEVASGASTNGAAQVMLETAPGHPATLLGAFAIDSEGCRSGCGPLVVRLTQFDFGWGRADLSSIGRDGSIHQIGAVLAGEGQLDGPQQECCGIASQPDGSGIRPTMGDKAFDYNSCSGNSSEVSVQSGSDASSRNSAGNALAEGEPVTEQGRQPLTLSVFVAQGTDCTIPPNEAFRVFTGQGLSGSAARECRSLIRSRQGATFAGDPSCADIYSFIRTADLQMITIESAGQFNLREAGETSPSAFRLCSGADVPDYLQRRLESGK